MLSIYVPYFVYNSQVGPRQEALLSLARVNLNGTYLILSEVNQPAEPEINARGPFQEGSVPCASPQEWLKD